MPDDPAEDLLAKYKRLSPAETEQLTAVLAELAAAELPLAQGLRAAAQEASSRRLARSLNRLAGELEQGRSLADLLADPRQPLPPHVAGIIAAGMRTGRLGTALADYFEQQRATYDLRRSARAALAYPAMLMGFILALYAFMSLFVVSPLKEMFADFQVRLSPWVLAMMWIGTYGVWFALAAIAVVSAALVIMRPMLGASRWQFLMSAAPLVGPIWHWTGVAEAMRLLALLVEQQVALPEALTLTAGGVRNADIAEACGRLSREVVSGAPLSDLLASSRLPPLIAPLARWGEATGELSSAFVTVGDFFESRARRRIELLRIVIPPMVFVLIGCSVAFIVLGLFAPMLQLISGLSG